MISRKSCSDFSHNYFPMKTRKQLLSLFRAKYDELLPKYPQVGPFEAGRLSSSGGTAIYDFGGGRARFVLGADNRVREVHGGIYDCWHEGDTCRWLGLPVENEDDYRGPDARRGDRVSVFENGSIVWRADTEKTEVRVLGDPSQIADADTIHEPDIRKSAVDHLKGGVLVFHSYTSYEAEDSRLFLFDFRTRELSCPSDSWKILRHAMNAHFSPDGKWLTFMGISNDSGNWDVFLHEIGSDSEPINLTEKYGGRNEDPKWHPHGHKIVFKHNGTHLVETDEAGKAFTVLADGGSKELSMPYYTTDGHFLLISTITKPDPDPDKRFSIMETANLKSGERRRLYEDFERRRPYYPIAEGTSSFVFAVKKSETDRHDQIYRGFVDGREAVPLVFNRDDADTSDPFPIGDGWYFVSSTREPRKGVYGLFLADSKIGKAIPLSDIDPRIGTERQDLGACFWKDPATTRQTKTDETTETNMDIICDKNLVAMKPNDWVGFLNPPFEETTFCALASTDPHKCFAEVSVHLNRYRHLVREKIIQGNISGIGLETPIYRTMTCENFHKTLLSGKLHLSNPLEWAKSGDPWESLIISGGVYCHSDSEKAHNLTEQVKQYLLHWYGQSWSLTKECEAIWSRYTKDGGRAVRISTTVRKLMLAMFQDDKFHRTTFLNKISYLSEAELEDAKRNIKAPLGAEASIRDLLSLKRKAYAYENEIRLLVWDQDADNTCNVGVSFDFPLKRGAASFIESVVFDPDCPNVYLEAENAFMHEHGYLGKATKSTLKAPSLSPAIISPDNRC